jgi:putative membrane protein
MLNIFRIFISDFKRLKTNVVAVVMVIGLSILPCLYAWFNILSNWSPYGPDATSNIKVAVASDARESRLTTPSLTWVRL